MARWGEKHTIVHEGTWIQECLFFLVCFFYLLLQIRPVLILESQQPVFFKGAGFLGQFLKVPGGLVDWLSRLFMQFWFSNFLGALFLTFCFWIVTLLTRKWIETLTENRPIHTFHLIPAGLLLVLHNQYDFQLSITLALIINLFFLVLFIRWMPKQPVIRIGSSLVILILLYWLTGGAFFIFVVLCALDELLFRKQTANGLLLVVLSAVLPFVVFSSVVLITLRQAYLHNLIFENPIELWIAGYALPAFFLLVILIASLAKFPIIRKLFQKFPRLAYVWIWTAGTVLLLCGTILFAKESTNDIKRLVLQINRAVNENRWSDVLESARQCSNITPLVSCQTNLALFQSGMLLDNMFAYPQTKGPLGLLMNTTWCFSWPEEASNVAWRLGLVNESLHWAHETFEHKGPTPDILKRLGMIYMIKGDNEAASHFFLNLKNIPFQGDTAESLIRLNENPTNLAQDSTCKYIQSCMPIEDSILHDKISSPKLELLLKRNPKNKMAFEYLIAYHLLSSNMKGIWDRIPDFETLNYAKLPRHVQEALIVIGSMTPNFDMNKLKGWIDPRILNRFVEYRKIVIKLKEGGRSAKQELQARFGDTYWYYMMFVKVAPRQSESQNEYQ